ncbi:MAG: hypothetical protein CBC92_004760, partial [Euryarchaeota archaeon TMED132]
AKKLFFDVIPKSIDEYYNHLKKFHSIDSSDKYNSPIWHIHKEFIPSVNSEITFNSLLNLVSVCNSSEKEVIWGFIKEYDKDINPNENSELEDSTDSQSNDTKSWLYVSFILVLISLASIIIIRRKISSQNSKLEDAKDKTIVEINPPIMPALQVGVGNDEQLTVLHQWTDNNGYTWKQMSDRSMLWWNGQEWVPVNYN